MRGACLRRGEHYRIVPARRAGHGGELFPLGACALQMLIGFEYLVYRFDRQIERRQNKYDWETRIAQHTDPVIGL